MRDHVRFYLNGEPHTIRGDDAFVTLTNYLRGPLGKVGTKVVCSEGDCGACTILAGRWRGEEIRYEPVDACILFLHQLDGTHVVTVEGLPEGEGLHPVQQAMVDHHGSQCGFCTPGIVMALAGWAEAGCPHEPASPRISLTGNLCRCTGYLPIVEAADKLKREPPCSLNRREKFAPLQNDLRRIASEPLKIEMATRLYFAPTTLAEAIAFKVQHPDAVILAGGTELGVLHNKRGYDPLKILSLTRIGELNAITRTPRQISFGANVNWTQVEEAIREPLPEFHKIVQRFGSPQIRNVGTLAGNVANGSPIADSLGLLMVMDATLELASPRGTRQRPINGFYTGYKKKDMAADELIARVHLPLPDTADRIRLTKVSRRFDLDIATFGAAIRIRDTGGVIQQAAVALTGVAATVVRLAETEAFLRGRAFDESTFQQAGRIARSEIRPIDDVRGSRDFRLQLAENVLLKFYHDEMEAAPMRAKART
ncbi:MAG: FAD binding domain-containing protein [Planctomycetes bacterium]|nr:FAD binding domain-containing protein [Planctomycetota bacterium]